MKRAEVQTFILRITSTSKYDERVNAEWDVSCMSPVKSKNHPRFIKVMDAVLRAVKRNI